MKVKSIKSVYLTLEELKSAVFGYLCREGRLDLAEHLSNNVCDFEWSHQDDGTYLAVDMDGLWEDE